MKRRRERAFVTILMTLSSSMLASGCDGILPEFRITVTGVPEQTTRLQIAAYVGDILTQDDAEVAVSGPQEQFSFGVNFKDMLHNTEASLSVAARRDDGCILAVGTSGVERPTLAVTDVTIPLSQPMPKLEDGDVACKAAPLTIVSVLRRQEGPYQGTLFSLQVAGWGFQKGLTATVRSTASVACESGQTCTSRCVRDQTESCVRQISSSAQCYHNCDMDMTLVPVGPGLVQIDLHSSMELLNTSPVVDFSSLIASPLAITLQNPDGQIVNFTEISKYPR